MNISLMMFTAVITTLGLVFITEFSGRKRALSVKKFLGFLTIAPFLSILIHLLFSMVIDLDNAGEASSATSEELIAMLPETIISALIGGMVGFIIWGIYRLVKRYV